MFDIGFWELVMIAVLALLVIGPERLPGVARTLGVWVGRGRRLVNQLKTDVAREMKAEELKRLLEQQKNSIASDEILETTRETLHDIGSGVGDALKARPSGDTPSRSETAEPARKDPGR